MEAKHTPGPWHLHAKKYIYAGSPGRLIASVNADKRQPDYDDTKQDGESWLDWRERTAPIRDKIEQERDANLALVAAAPELLQTLIDGKSKSWVHNAGITHDIEALRKICLEQSEWWNKKAVPLLQKLGVI